MKNNKEQAKQLKALLALLVKEESKPAEKVQPTTTQLQEQLSLTMAELNRELSRSEPSTKRLKYFFNKINILEAHL